MTGLSNKEVIYLAVMLGVILVLTALLVPALFLKQCARCGKRNMLDATECKQCKKPFPAKDGPGKSQGPKV